MKDDQSPPQVTVLLRLLGGGYLVYLAYGLFTDNDGKLFLILAAAVFALVGAALFVSSLLSLVRSGYFRNAPTQQPENAAQEPDDSSTSETE